MSDLQKKAKEYAKTLENYKNLNVTPSELSNYHILSEQQFDNYVGELEDSLQEDVKKIPDVITIFNKILSPFKKD